MFHRDKSAIPMVEEIRPPSLAANGSAIVPTPMHILAMFNDVSDTDA